MDYQNVQVMASETDYKKRTVLKMFQIKKDQNLVNIRRDIQNLPQVYNNLMSSFHS